MGKICEIANIIGDFTQKEEMVLIRNSTMQNSSDSISVRNQPKIFTSIITMIIIKIPTQCYDELIRGMMFRNMSPLCRRHPLGSLPAWRQAGARVTILCITKGFKGGMSVYKKRFSL
jgi:hypothetical protein